MRIGETAKTTMHSNFDWNQRINGNIAIRPLGKGTRGGSAFLKLVKERQRYVWQPPYQITKLPDWYELALDCYVFANPLTEIEEFYFSQVFLSSTACGGLPLLLLRDRYPDLSAAIINVWNHPDDKTTVPILHRVMLYSAELLANRRAADKQYKRRSHAKDKSGRLAIESTINYDKQENSAKSEEAMFLVIAKKLAFGRGIDCEYGEWE